MLCLVAVIDSLACCIRRQHGSPSAAFVLKDWQHESAIRRCIYLMTQLRYCYKYLRLLVLMLCPAAGGCEERVLGVC